MAIGDHLIVVYGVYQHHGIDVGGGQVVHFGRGVQDLERAVVELISISDFCQGRKCRVAFSPAAYSGEEIAQRARSRIGERGYDLFDNNCEHFAHWCRSGERRSVQSHAVQSTIRAALSMAAKRNAWLAVGKSTKWIKVAHLLPEIAQAAADSLVVQRGGSDVQGRRTGAAAGMAAAIAVGLLRGGPAGASLSVACWAAGQTVSGPMLNPTLAVLKRSAAKVFALRRNSFAGPADIH